MRSYQDLDVFPSRKKVMGLLSNGEFGRKLYTGNRNILRWKEKILFLPSWKTAH
jgi:hypothetical protein